MRIFRFVMATVTALTVTFCGENEAIFLLRLPFVSFSTSSSPSVARCPVVDNRFKCKPPLRHLMGMNTKNKTKWEQNKIKKHQIRCMLRRFIELFSISLLAAYTLLFLFLSAMNHIVWANSSGRLHANSSETTNRWKNIYQILFCDFSSMEIVLNASKSLNSVLTQLFEHAQWNWITFIFTSTQTYTVVLDPLVSLFPRSLSFSRRVSLSLLTLWFMPAKYSHIQVHTIPIKSKASSRKSSFFMANKYIYVHIKQMRWW